MLLDPTRFSEGHIERTTVCIAGSGPAGMSLAQALIQKGIDVLMVEAGGIEWEDESQELFAGEVKGDDYFDLRDARLRMLGGSSGHWGGICRPLSRANLAQSTATGATGWPILYDTLEPYEAETNEILEIPGNFQDREMAPGLFELDFQQSPPVLFADKYFGLIENHPQLRVAVNTPLVGVSHDAGQITAATVTTRGAGAWRIEADYFVLGLGGIENSRILRWLNEQNGRALIANHDLIGRYWMEHLHSQPIHGLIYGEVLEQKIRDADRFFIGTSSLDIEDQLAGVNFEFGQLRESDTYSMAESMMCVAPRLGNRIVGLMGRNLVCGVLMTAHSEQWPHAENRITLADDRDILGIPRTVLHWRRMEADRDLIMNRSETLAARFAQSDLGRFMMIKWARSGDPIPDEPRSGAWHHMGGTRMSEHPDNGIVNPDCRVHDLENLYIAGSSVFPTGGDANPTYTIVQLSLRLADHLERRLRA